MTRIFWALFCVSGLTGALISMSLNDSEGGGSGPAQAASWEAPDLPTDYTNAAGQFLSVFRGGKLFQSDQSRDEAPDTARGEPGELTRSSFPTVLSISTTDGTLRAHLKHSDGTISSVAAGDQTIEGWAVTRISSNAVMAEYDGESHLFVLFEPDT